MPYLFSSNPVSEASDDKTLQKYATFGVEFEISRRRHAGMHQSAMCEASDDKKSQKYAGVFKIKAKLTHKNM